MTSLISHAPRQATRLNLINLDHQRLGHELLVEVHEELGEEHEARQARDHAQQHDAHRADAGAVRVLGPHVAVAHRL